MLYRAVSTNRCEFSDVSVRLPGGRIALTLPALRGRLAASSGLLVLVYFIRPAAGRCAARVRGCAVQLLNGAAPLCHPALVGYVPQDDGALLGWLTCASCCASTPFCAASFFPPRSVWGRSDAVGALMTWGAPSTPVITQAIRGGGRPRGR